MKDIKRIRRLVQRFEPTGSNAVRNKTNKKKRNKKNSSKIEESLNISSLVQSLPIIDAGPNFQPQPQTRKSHPKPPQIGLNIKPVKSQTARKRIMKEEIQRFHKVMQHSAFKADPLSTVKQHVENTIEKKVCIPSDNSSMNVNK
ncbi:ribosome biogenesis protein [Gigaspora margarita]|uniref:Ribosome biogenesis protein SLX9 n=1 Tax=Gigaspora margarita TaxID=4874 RepID=A0A8H3XCS7_GIGMA|nr:ribosome biogenesis protein [Gigaspora margarita]